MVLGLVAPQLAALPWEALFDTEIDAYICILRWIWRMPLDTIALSNPPPQSGPQAL